MKKNIKIILMVIILPLFCNNVSLADEIQTKTTKDALNVQNETLKTTRDSLLPKLMSGEIEVNG